MSDKLQCGITGISLDDATFKKTGAYITPTYINYFFGNNGAGKTTIAKTIKSGSGVSYAPGKTADDFQLLVFDQDFIYDNMHRYHDLDGVFTINETNVEIQKEIDVRMNEQTAAGKILSEAAAEIEKKQKEKDTLYEKLKETCWSNTKYIRTTFVKTQNKTKASKKSFVEAVKSHSPVRHNIDELKRMYDSSYSDSAKTYEFFNTIRDVSVLDCLPGKEILELAIVNISDTPFAEFLKAVGSTEWVRQGHSVYHEKANGRCPYCSGNLPADFEDMLTASFDTQYQTNLEKLKRFLNLYISTANTLFVPLGKLPKEIYPAIDIRPYNDKLNLIRSVISSNIDKIREKINEPSKIISLEKVSGYLKELSDIIKNFNSLIDYNNKIVLSGSKKEENCTNAVFEHISFLLKNVLNDYKEREAILDEDIKKQQKIINAQKLTLDRLKTELQDLKSHTVETETAMNNINVMLRDSGFQGFELRPHNENSGRIYDPCLTVNYEVVRTDTGKIAENLSDGEKNFIAFLYFQQKVFGSDSADQDTQNKIVVIDDPVSGMDGGTLFAVSAQVRKMIEICRNNADSRDPVASGNFIKQIFILTHNAIFHREISYAYADRYDFVSFYQIRKLDNKSSIRLCDRENPDCPAERVNVNPVKNSYAALWEEYKEVSSCIPLMSIIRRILEYYFLQLCGYEGKDLRYHILEENKAAFTHDKYGNEDYTKYDMASAMLSYIAAGSSGMNNDMNYFDDYSDIQQCRDTFHMIFHCMGQDQHYDMMMGIK